MGTLSHTRDPIEGIHVGAFAKSILNTRGAIRRRVIVRLLGHGPVTACRWNITGKFLASKFIEPQRTSLMLRGGHEATRHRICVVQRQHSWAVRNQGM